ncbi:MAG: CoA-acylating methylmalonate-semialdehyde dehydrogenase [Anaerolineales bacterium]|nr:CoA-acylating methylmalonate-semialdehyde dehydrogenase [Anaerolineales bacterium]
MQKVLNYINGQWREDHAAEYLDVINPASQELLARTPLCAASVVDEAARAAANAYPAWRNTPPGDRIQPLFKLKALMEEHLDELARTITLENGKVYGESVGEMRRAIENVEVACGTPTMMLGDVLEDVASGIDEYMIRQPVGVVATIAPFNFPGMIPFWYLPYALACGNTYIVKPSERVPLTMQKVFELLDQCGFPPGVVNMVNGGVETVNAILDHPTIRGVTFVGSTAVAKHVYSRASLNGKRVQAQGGAKNPTIILPDAEVDMTTKIIADSAFGCAGQRCLATSLVFTVGKADEIFTPALADAALQRVTGFGLDDGVQMGPVITHASKARIEGLIARGVSEGAELVVDGRGKAVGGYEGGSFLHPTLLCGLNPQGEVIRTEIFGPVLGMVHLDTVEDAIELVNSGQYGNMACLFTSSGAAARKFRHDADAGNIGINIGVAAPMAYFPFSGWKDSFFGTLHGQGKHAVEFFTQTKVVVERWPKDWSRQF